MEVRTNRSSPGSQQGSGATQQTQPALPPRPPPANGVLPSTASPGPQRSREQPMSASLVLTAGAPLMAPQEKHPPSWLLSLSRELIQPGDVWGGWNVGFCPPPLQPPHLVGHRILLMASQMCLALLQGLCNPCAQAMRPRGRGRHPEPDQRSEKKGPKRRERTAGLERRVVQDSQEEERLFQAMERAGPRHEGTEEPGLWEGEL